MRTYVDYLMLDKDDITKVCGVISSKEILKEMTSSKFRSMLINGKFFRDKYILVEKDHDDVKADIEDIKFDEDDEKYFYASKNGEFFTISKKTGKKRFLKKFLHHGYATVKGKGNKYYRAKNLIAQIFLGAKKRDGVTLKNDDPFDCSVDNLIVIPLREHLSQRRKNNVRNIGLYENGELVKTWKCSSDCAKELYCAKRTVHSILRKEYKNQMYDLRYMEG